MQLDFSFNLTEIAVEAMRNRSRNMLNDSSKIGNSETSVPERVDDGNNMFVESGATNLRDLVNLPVQTTNMIVAAQTYETNIGLLDSYRQLTEIKLELYG